MQRALTFIFTLALLPGLGAADAPEAGGSDGANGVVALPPYFVQESLGGRTWHYGTLPGFEILSRCDDSTSERFAQRLYHLQFLIREMVPADLQVGTAMPIAVLLVSQDMEKAMSKEMVSQMEGTAKVANDHASSRDGLRAAPTLLRLIPQMRLWDEDSTSIDFVLTDKYEDYDALALSPDYVSYMLSRRLPPLPQWFAQGVMDLYVNGVVSEDSIKITHADWISNDITDAIKRNPATPRVLIPLQEFLTAPRPPLGGDDAAQQQFLIWRSEAALFVRWGLDGGDNHPRRQALWKFVDRASSEPVTEAMFQDCFGHSFAEMDALLNAYLPEAVADSFVLNLVTPAKPPVIEMRNATSAEVGRIQGDWESKEIKFVKARYPNFTKKYIDETDRTLEAAYDPRTADPGLLAVMGLFQAEEGSVVQARKFLERAVAAKVVRPRAYVELARLRLNEAQAKPEGPGGMLSAAQAASVLDLLRAARQQEPPQYNTYALMTDVWYRTAPPIPADDLAILTEGIHFFPHNPELSLGVATLAARNGLKAEAASLIVRALPSVSDDTLRSRFLKLQALVEPHPN